MLLEMGHKPDDEVQTMMCNSATMFTVGCRNEGEKKGKRAYCLALYLVSLSLSLSLFHIATNITDITVIKTTRSHLAAAKVTTAL